MEPVRKIYFIFWVIIIILVNISWQIENERAARILLGLAIELTFIYAAYYGGMMS